jgi:hypothetical protein
MDPRGGQKRSVGRASSEPARVATGGGAPGFGLGLAAAGLAGAGGDPADTVGAAGTEGTAPSAGAFWARLG